MNRHSLTQLYAVGLTVAVFAAMAFGLAAGQESGVIGQFTPFVIDVVQEVPVRVDAPIVLDSGEVVTATTPLTIGVELRIRVDGPQQTVVEVLETPAPKVALATATPMPDGGPAVLGRDVAVGRVRWKITAADEIGSTLKSDNQFVEDKTTAGRFIRLSFEVENIGRETKTFEDILLVDSRERSYEPFQEAYNFVPDGEQCQWYTELNPNIPMTCTTIFEVAADAEGLQAYVTNLESRDLEEAYIDLGF